MVLLILIAVVICLSLVYSVLAKDPKDPPGPILLPFVGNLFSFPLWHPPQKAMAKLADIYGDVMSIKIGSMDAVVLSSTNAARVVLSRPELQKLRPKNVFFEARSHGKDIGLAFSNGETWKKVRAFTMSRLSEAGLGQFEITEKIVFSELKHFNHLINELMQEKQGVIAVKGLFQPISANTIVSFFWDKRLEPKDHHFQKFLDGSDSFSKKSNLAITLTTAFPWIFRFGNRLTWVQDFLRTIDDLHIIPSEIIKDRKTQMSTDSEFFPDMFMKQMKLAMTDFDKETFTEEQLEAVLMDLLQAGTDTMAGFLEFMILYIAAFPKVQNRIFQEINKIDGPILIKDRKLTPYTEATMMEVHRHAKIVVTLLPRETEKTFYYKGFRIRKGTCIIPNQESINLDPKVWENPHKFDPQRFLTLEGSLDIVKCRNLIPYGIGKRVCLGQKLAEQVLYLSVANIIKIYRFSAPREVQYDFTSLPGLIARPGPFDVFVENRA